MIAPAVCVSICLPSCCRRRSLVSLVLGVFSVCPKCHPSRWQLSKLCGAGAVSKIDRRTTSCHWVFSELFSRFSKICAERWASAQHHQHLTKNGKHKTKKKTCQREFAHPLFTMNNSSNLGGCCSFWGCRTFVDDGPGANSPERRVLHICYSDSVCSYASVERKVSTRALAFFYGSFFPRYTPSISPPFFHQSSKSNAGHMAIDGPIGNAQLYKYFIYAKIPSVVLVYLKPGVFLSSKGSYRPGVAILVLRFIVRRRGEGENSINILRVSGNVLQL